MNRYPMLVAFHFRAVSHADCDRKLQWLTRALRLDDLDWQLIVDLLGTEADQQGDERAREILRFLDVEARPPRPDIVALTRRRFAEAGLAALERDGIAVWARRVGAYRIAVSEPAGGLGVDPGEPYAVRVFAFNRLQPELASVMADDQPDALALLGEFAADPAGFIAQRGPQYPAVAA